MNRNDSVSTLFTFLSKSKSQTRALGIAIAALALLVMTGVLGATPVVLGLSLSVWCVCDGLLIALAASYSDPQDGQFRGTDAVMGVLMAGTGAVVLAAAGVYALIVRQS
jgi:hypothetical protein